MLKSLAFGLWHISRHYRFCVFIFLKTFPYLSLEPGTANSATWTWHISTCKSHTHLKPNMLKLNTCPSPHTCSSCSLPHFPEARANYLGIRFYLFLPHPTANPPANCNNSILKTYPKFHHFPSLSPWLPCWSNQPPWSVIWFIAMRPVSHLRSLSVILRKCKSDHVSHNSAQNPSRVSPSLRVKGKVLTWSLHSI